MRRRSCGEEFIDGGRGLQLFNGLAGNFAGGVFFQPFWPFSGLLHEKVFEVDNEVVGAEADGDAAGGFDGETHHGFVDGTDLFDVEGAVGNTLAVQIEEILEDAEEGAVGN